MNTNSIKRIKHNSGYLLINKDGHLTRYPDLIRAMNWLFIDAIKNRRNADYSEVNF